MPVAKRLPYGLTPMGPDSGGSPRTSTLSMSSSILPFARVFTRAGFDPIKIPFKVVGYETLITQRPVGGKTGALTAVSSTKTKTTEAKESPAKAGEWITLEVFAKGDSMSVKVDGAVGCELVDEKRQIAR